MKLFDVIQPHEILNRDLISDVEITGLCFDSRNVTKGCVFFALPGTKTDGARFVADAVRTGAVTVVCPADSVLTGLSVPVIAVRDSRASLALAASRFYHEPTRSFYLCGVTGTKGKTTITYLLEKIWGERNTGVIGTVNFRYTGKIIPATHTTPDALALQSMFAEMVRKNIRFVVMETSSHALEQRRIAGSQFDCAVFTNLSQEHMDYHGTMEAYFASKKILFSDLLQRSEKKIRLAVINIDDPFGQRLAQEVKHASFSVQTFSCHDAQADLWLKEAQYTMQGTQAILEYKDKEHHVQTNLLGEYNMRNIMAAFLVACHSGVDVEQILNAVQTVDVPGRLQRVGDSNFFIDYAHVPDALSNVLRAMREIMNSPSTPLRQGLRLSSSEGPQGRSGQVSAMPRLGVVFGCGGDRDRTKRPVMGKVAAELADFVIVTSDNPRTEDPQSIVDQILPGVCGVLKPFDGERGYLVEVDRHKAVQKAVEIARSDDVVIVAGKGHEDYQILGTQKVHFDDVEEVSRCLGAKVRTS